MGHIIAKAARVCHSQKYTFAAPAGGAALLDKFTLLGSRDHAKLVCARLLRTETFALEK